MPQAPAAEGATITIQNRIDCRDGVRAGVRAGVGAAGVRAGAGAGAGAQAEVPPFSSWSACHN